MKLLENHITQFSVITAVNGFICKCNNLDEIDHEILENIEDLWFYISCTSKILFFCNKHEEDKEIFTTLASLFHHNELFLSIKDLESKRMEITEIYA